MKKSATFVLASLGGLRRLAPALPAPVPRSNQGQPPVGRATVRIAPFGPCCGKARLGAGGGMRVRNAAFVHTLRASPMLSVTPSLPRFPGGYLFFNRPLGVGSPCRGLSSLSGANAYDGGKRDVGNHAPTEQDFP